MFRIGVHTITNPALLAPMAGITDLPFRQLCTGFGAGLATSEMVTSDTRFWHSVKSAPRLAMESGHLRSVQIAGSDPQQMAEAAEKCVEMGAQIVDINMGCPVKKVCKRLAGSALLQDEDLVARILESVVNAVKVPVTLKTRTGWSREQRNGLRIAKLAEDIGIATIAVHGRTRACRFEGEAEYETIAEIVAALKIPVLANGDIHSSHKALEVMKITGAAGVLIGRGALGNPWIFQEIQQRLTGEVPKPGPNLKERHRVLLEHIAAIHAFYGEEKGVQMARKHYFWYCQGLDDFDKQKGKFNALLNTQAQLTSISDYFNWLQNIEEKAA